MQCGALACTCVERSHFLQTGTGCSFLRVQTRAELPAISLILTPWTEPCSCILDMRVYVYDYIVFDPGIILCVQCWLFPDAAVAQQAALSLSAAAQHLEQDGRRSTSFACQQRASSKKPVVCCSTPAQCGAEAPHTFIGFQGSFSGPASSGLQASQHAPAMPSPVGTSGRMKFYATSDLASVFGALSTSAGCTVLLDPLCTRVPGLPWNQASIEAIASYVHKSPRKFMIMDSSDHSIGRCGALFPHDLFASGSGGAFSGLQVSKAASPQQVDPLMQQSLAQHKAAALLESVPQVQASPHCRPDAVILGRGLTLAPCGLAALLLSPTLTQATAHAGHAVFHSRSEQLRRMAVEPHCHHSAALVHGTAAAQPAAVSYGGGSVAEQVLEGVRRDLQDPWTDKAVNTVKRVVRRSVPVARLLMSYLDRLPVAHRDQVQDVFGPPPHPCSNGSDHCALDSTLALKGPAQRLRHTACANGLLLQSADGFVGREDSRPWNAAAVGNSRPWHADRFMRIVPPMTLREEDARAGLAVLDASFAKPTDLL